MTYRHLTVTINFMPPGHTKFAPDWCFGLLKRRFRRTAVSCLDDLSKVVESSTPVKKVNTAQVVADESGVNINVPSYDWQKFLTSHFKPFVGIKKVGHFRFSSDMQGKVEYVQGDSCR